MERLEPGRQGVAFYTASGILTAQRVGTFYVLNFPARPFDPGPSLAELADALGIVPIEVVANQFNYLALLETEEQLKALARDMRALAEIVRPGSNRNRQERWAI